MSLQRPRTKDEIAFLLDVRRRAVWDAAACAQITAHAGRPLTIKRLTYAWCDDRSRAHERAAQVLAGRQPYQKAGRILATTRLPQLEHSPDWSSAENWANYFKREQMLGKRTFAYLYLRACRDSTRRTAANYRSVERVHAWAGSRLGRTDDCYVMHVQFITRVRFAELLANGTFLTNNAVESQNRLVKSDSNKLDPLLATVQVNDGYDRHAHRTVPQSLTHQRQLAQTRAHHETARSHRGASVCACYFAGLRGGPQQRAWPPKSRRRSSSRRVVEDARPASPGSSQAQAGSPRWQWQCPQ